MDTLVALVAGMAIFPIVFANGLEPGAGPGLVFISLPIAFGQMPGGLFFGTLFFVLLTFAAWTSAISIIEPAVAFLVENQGMGRKAATGVVVGLAWAVGLLTVMSFGGWGFEFEFAGARKTDGIFDILDIATTNFMLPLGGLTIALFAGWVMSSTDTADELGVGKQTASYRLWRVLVRFVAPAGVILFFLHSLSVF